MGLLSMADLSGLGDPLRSGGILLRQRWLTPSERKDQALMVSVARATARDKRLSRIYRTTPSAAHAIAERDKALSLANRISSISRSVSSAGSSAVVSAADAAAAAKYGLPPSVAHALARRDEALATGASSEKIDWGFDDAWKPGNSTPYGPTRPTPPSSSPGEPWWSAPRAPGEPLDWASAGKPAFPPTGQNVRPKWVQPEPLRPTGHTLADVRKRRELDRAKREADRAKMQKERAERWRAQAEARPPVRPKPKQEPFIIASYPEGDAATAIGITPQQLKAEQERAKLKAQQSSMARFWNKINAGGGLPGSQADADMNVAIRAGRGVSQNARHGASTGSSLGPSGGFVARGVNGVGRLGYCAGLAGLG